MNLYCKIFLRSGLERPQLLNQLAALCGGAVEMRTITTDYFEADVVHNSDHDPARQDELGGGFLYAPYFLDVEPTGGTDDLQYIGAVRRFVGRLSEAGLKPTAACDFEAELVQPQLTPAATDSPAA